MFVFIVFALVQLADVISTVMALRAGAREANPVVAWFMTALGDYGWIGVKLLVSCLGAWVLWRTDNLIWIWLLNAIVLWVALQNTRIARKRQRKGG